MFIIATYSQCGINDFGDGDGGRLKIALNLRGER